MKRANDLLLEQFPHMRERCLSLAADFDRLARSPGGMAAIDSEPLLVSLREALVMAADASDSRAKRVLERFSQQ